MWLSFFDVGLGNGMRNYMTQAISANDYKTARAYLSTTLCVLTLISIGLGLLCIPCLALDFNTVAGTILYLLFYPSLRWKNRNDKYNTQHGRLLYSDVRSASISVRAAD